MINWKLRLQNKTSLSSLICTTIALVYLILGIIGVTPPISEDDAVQWVGVFMTLLADLGIIVDPTTLGFGDSARAMSYTAPNVDDGDLDDYDDGDEITLEELLEVLKDDEDPDDDEEVEEQENEE